VIEPNAIEKWLYFVIGRRPSVEYREWTERDIASPAWRQRQAVQYVLALAIGIAIVAFIMDAGVPIVFGTLISGLFITALRTIVLGEEQRIQALNRYRRAWDRASAPDRSA
jgi:hypothetical protein